MVLENPSVRRRLSSHRCCIGSLREDYALQCLNKTIGAKVKLKALVATKRKALRGYVFHITHVYVNYICNILFTIV